MKAVASYFGKEVLLGLTIEDILSHAQELREKLGDRAVLRALHFLCEDVRVEEEIDALKAGDIDAFLQKVKESGDSSFKYLQNVYTSHDVMHQNVSLALAVSEIALAGGAGVARVHGGGFARYDSGICEKRGCIRISCSDGSVVRCRCVQGA